MNYDDKIIDDWLTSIGKPHTKIPGEVWQAIYDQEIKRRRFPLLTQLESEYSTRYQDNGHVLSK